MYPSPHLLPCELTKNQVQVSKNDSCPPSCRHPRSRCRRPTRLTIPIRKIPGQKTYFSSRIPFPSFQNPYVMMPATPTRYRDGLKPRAGRLRLYWTARYPPTGGMSCGIVGAGDSWIVRARRGRTENGVGERGWRGHRPRAYSLRCGVFLRSRRQLRVLMFGVEV